MGRRLEIFLSSFAFGLHNIYSLALENNMKVLDIWVPDNQNVSGYCNHGNEQAVNSKWLQNVKKTITYIIFLKAQWTWLPIKEEPLIQKSLTKSIPLTTFMSCFAVCR